VRPSYGPAVPELPEVEAYRRLAEAAALGRRVTGVEAPDAWFLKGGIVADDVRVALVGSRLVLARRRGKLLLLDTDGGHTLGLRFGMTGRLVVDGVAGVQQLLYTSGRDEPAWDRFTVRFGRSGRLRVNDPRRLGGVLLDPKVDRLGPDALDATPAQVRAALRGSVAPLKARLLDQARLAGVGNLVADEVLWRAGLSPLRPAGSLLPAEHRRLQRELKRTVEVLIERGGSHLGDVTPHRRPGGTCPKDGADLRRDTVGGRTTWWCPAHQR
jgi:formamidopyrimidine-DNA glycosylase